MSAYIVCLISVTELDRYRQYVELAGPAVLRNGGRFLVRGAPFEMLEGSVSGERLIVAEFSDADTARRSYDSAEYQAARRHRLGAAAFNAMVVSGA